MNGKIIKKIIIIFILIVVVLSIFYFYDKKNKTESVFLFSTSTPSNGAETESAPQYVPTSLPSVYLQNGTVQYKNTFYKFSLDYPADISVSEYVETEGGRSIVFESKKSGEKRGFQIFIVPYKYNQITKERFQMDEPSGIMKDPQDILIDGKRATMFFSSNSIMGEVREVWFINNGFLYEVVTYKDFDSSLSQIMKTWKFI